MGSRRSDTAVLTHFRQIRVRVLKSLRGYNNKMSARRKSSIMNKRKLSVDFSRKLSAISCASDVSCISGRFGMEQGQLKNIVQDILEMDNNQEWELGSEDELSDTGMTGMTMTSPSGRSCRMRLYRLMTGKLQPDQQDQRPALTL
eukprot:TRINITY_DN4918_c0_g1_i3.p1 TRINITY_DN4918_c0_g1~~TRINITY_DN4918_c0_g1_i3.p1  ORF type:complete len:145 (-),score=18.96 TRINITY_DN4918_c0_g1_i3:188-622(-)